MTDSVEGVGKMEGTAFPQRAVFLKGSLLDLKLADPEQIIVEKVFIVHLEPQNVKFPSTEVGELLLPPGVDFIVADACCTQTGGAAEHLDIAIRDSQQISGKISGPQVKHLQLGLSQAQTAQGQQEERKTGGHDFTGSCGEGTAKLDCCCNGFQNSLSK